jgi:hypothetical protein
MPNLNRPHNFVPLEKGMKFSSWTVLDSTPTIGNNYKSYYLCRCDCGTIKKVQTTYLRKARSKSCKSCKNLKAESSRWKGCGDLPSAYFSRTKGGAVRRNFPFEITIEDAWKLFQDQNGTCALSGVPLVFGNGKKFEYTASLDRIDSANGYVYGNVQWVHKDINRMKGPYKEGYFVELCGSVFQKRNNHGGL